MLFFFQAEYKKDAAKSRQDYTLPADAPQFAKAKEVAKNTSDVSVPIRNHWFD